MTNSSALSFPTPCLRVKTTDPSVQETGLPWQPRIGTFQAPLSDRGVYFGYPILVGNKHSFWRAPVYTELVRARHRKQHPSGKSFCR
jgi:hypothetical protein